MWKLPRPRVQFIAGLLALVVLASATLEGCGESADRSVKIVAPAQGTNVTAGDVKVSVDVKKFNIVDKLDQQPKDGEGHVHFYLDVGQIPTKDAEPAITRQGTYHAQATKEYTWPNVAPGEHTFAVQLVNNDHTPLRPPVIAQVTVEVKAGGGATAPARSPTASPAGSPSRTTPAEGSPTSTPGGGGATSPAATAAPTPTATATLPIATPTP